jgi:uncharacterized membrane protein
MSSALKTYWSEICLLAIVIAGMALRLYHLDYQGSFSEELFTISGNSASYYQILADSVINSQSGQAPLYFFVDKISTDLLGGISLVSIRLPSVIFGVLCIVAIYVLGKEYHDKITGLLAALVLAVSDRAVFYSQYARPYTLVFLLFIGATYCFMKLERGESFKRWMPLFILSSALCLWTHYYSIVPLSVFWLILVWQAGKKIVPYLAIAAVSVVSFVLYLRDLIYVYLTNQGWAARAPSIFRVTWIDIMFRVPYECWGYATVFMVPLFLFHLWKGGDKISVYFGLAAGITYVITMLSTFVFGPSARYVVLIAPLIIVPALVPVSRFIGNRERSAQKVVIIAGIVYLILIANVFSLIAWYTTTYHFVFL